MLKLVPGALVSYGWSDRVLALYTSAVDADRARAPGATYQLLPARITRVERSSCVAVGPDGGERPLRCNPLPAVGDWVLAGSGELWDVLPRWATLTRVDPAGDGAQTLAANVDIVLITTPADRGSPTRVEREITLAWDSGAVPLVVVTKTDLDPGGVVDALAERLVGVEVIGVSATAGVGVDDLRGRLAPDRTAVLLGPSGAGKSTLANALLRTELLATAAVRAADRRGRHTTSSRQLVAISSGGVLIDTPGLRSLGLHGDLDINVAFPDLDQLAARCRFSDCRHQDEPGCAVTAAVRAGELDPDRLRSFHKLAREAAWEQRRHDPLKRQEDRALWRARTRDARAKQRYR